MTLKQRLESGPLSDEDAILAMHSGRRNIHLLLAKNPAAPAFAIDYLADELIKSMDVKTLDKQIDILLALTYRQDLSLQSWTHLFKALSSRRIGSYMGNYYGTSFFDMFSHLLDNYSTDGDLVTKQTLDMYAYNGSMLPQRVAEALASNPRLPPKLAHFLNETCAIGEVELALAKNILTPASLLSEYVLSSSRDVREAAMRNPYTPAKALNPVTLREIPKDVLLDRTHVYGGDIAQAISRLSPNMTFGEAVSVATASRSLGYRDIKGLARQALKFAGIKTKEEKFLDQARSRMNAAADVIRAIIPDFSQGSSNFVQATFEALNLTLAQADLYQGLLSKPNTPPGVFLDAQNKLRRYVVALESIASDMRELGELPWCDVTAPGDPFDAAQAYTASLKELKKS